MSEDTVAPRPIEDRPDPWARWAASLGPFLEGWLSDFSWHGTPWVAKSLRISCGTQQLDLYGPPSSREAPGPLVDKASAIAMIESPWRDEWIDVLEELCAGKLEGTWLHPDWLYELDQLNLAENTASLPIGCLDQTNPTLPRRFDPARASWAHDLGVVNFPLHSRDRCVQWTAERVPPATQASLLIASVLYETGVHESLELHQSRPGKAWINPHRTEIRSRLELEVAGERYVVEGRI